ncbi:MAG: porin [Myxococcota bacterium]
MPVLPLLLSLLLLLLAPGARAADDGDPLATDKYRLGEGLQFSTTRGHQLRLFTYMQPLMEVRDYTQRGGDWLTRFRMRRLRLRVQGSSPRDRVAFRFQFDLAGANEVDTVENSFLLDGYVEFKPTKTLNIAFGQRATYTDNRELFMLSHTLQLPERSRVTSAFAAIREFGLFVRDRIRIGQSQHYLKPYVVITNGDGPNAFGNDFGGLKYGARLDYLPFGLFSRFGQFRQADLVREATPRLVVGATYSYNQGMSSRRGRASGDILYLDADDEPALPDFQKVGVDFLFKYKGFSMIGEWNRTFASVPDTITQRVRNDGSVSETFIPSVEGLVRGRMMLGRGYNIQAGYVLPSNTSIDARYTRLVPDEDSFLNNGTFYNRETYVTGGISQYYNALYGLKIQASLTYVDALEGSNDIRGQGFPIPGDEWIGRVITTLAL